MYFGGGFVFIEQGNFLLRAAFPAVATRFVLPLRSSTRAQTRRSIRAVAAE
jgi:hypothetical protein